MIGVPWYRKQDFDRLRSQFEDGDRLHTTWKQWHRAARAFVKGLEERGQAVLQVEILPAEFAEWCEGRAIAQNAQARMEFAARVARDHVEFSQQFAAGGELFLEKARSLSNDADLATVPIFRWRDEEVEFEGSGLLLYHAGLHVLVTAAHVFDRCEGGMLVEKLALSEKSLSGAAFGTRIPSGGTRDDDRLDTAVVILTAEEIEFFGTTRFLGLENAVESTPEDEYFISVVLGYAAGDQRVSHSAIEVKTTMFVTGLAEERGYKLAKVDPNTHVLLRYRRDLSLWNGAHTGMVPSLKGVSGCGAFYLPLHAERIGLQMLGIVVEQPQSFGPSLLVTRATFIRRMIEDIASRVRAPIVP